ncbi:MAG: adenylosuccinate synthetase [bacterium]
MNIDIVLGALFGDEGKGSTVNFLAKEAVNPLIVRFNGGHQVGHTVVHDENRHVFSNFGSGTLQNIPTYWSKYCTVNPVGVYNESKALNELGIKPQIYFDENAMITTPFDIVINHRLEKNNNHGSVGVGFGTTIQRNEDHYRLYVRDLKYPSIRDAKLESIRLNYYNLAYCESDTENENTFTNRMKTIVDEFINACDYLVNNFNIVNNPMTFNFSEFDLIFEGGQGILLDMDYGFFPNVTRSNTTSKNVFKFIDDNKLKVNSINTYYVTRTYQTRHGNGFMTNEILDTSYITENPNETNTTNKYQGQFRKTVLDLDLLRYSLDCDNYHNIHSNKMLVVTCLDQVPNEIPVTINGNVNVVQPKNIGDYFSLDTITSKSEKGIGF